MLPSPDLEAVAASIDQTLSLETGRVVPRTAWAGRAPDGAMDALFAWLPSVRSRRLLWERGQQLWTEQMTAALSGPCDECLEGASAPVPAATIIQPHQEVGTQPRQAETARPGTAPLPYGSATVAIPGGVGVSREPASREPLARDEGQTTAMPAFSDFDAPGSRMPEDAATSAVPSFSSSFGGAAPADQAAGAPAPPRVPDSDEHESHTVILSAMPSLRTTTRLVVLEGPVHGRQFSLGRQLTTIGRSIGCHVTIEADDVAYDHARVARSGDGWQIELIGEATEIRVNDDPVRDSRTLRDGDVIRIGPARLRFESASSAG